MEDADCHEFTTYSRLPRQEVRHVGGHSLRTLEKENDEPLLDGCGSLSAYHYSRGTGMGIPCMNTGS